MFVLGPFEPSVTISRTPDRPAISAENMESASLPSGEITPIPVTTTCLRSPAITPILPRPRPRAPRLIHPPGDEEVHLVAVGLGPPRGPDEILAVGAEDAEAVEAGSGGDALQPLPVF